MHEQKPRNLPWLDLMAIRLPGYGGYLDRGNRRAADRALRDAIAKRLQEAQVLIDKAIRSCMDQDALGIQPEIKGLEQEGVKALQEISAPERERHQLLTEVRSLERVRQHLERVLNRVKAAGSGTDDFYRSDRLDAPKADALHAFDLELFDRSDAIVRRFHEADLKHDFLADVESDLTEFEQKLDDRTRLLQGIT
jgi:hypothetical protein